MKYKILNTEVITQLLKEVQNNNGVTATCTDRGDITINYYSNGQIEFNTDVLHVIGNIPLQVAGMIDKYCIANEIDKGVMLTHGQRKRIRKCVTNQLRESGDSDILMLMGE